MLPIICIALALRPGAGARYRRSACIDMDMLRLAAAACCDMMCVLITVEKDRKHVLIQKVVILNTCCDVACLKF